MKEAKSNDFVGKQQDGFNLPVTVKLSVESCDYFNYFFFTVIKYYKVMRMK